VLDTLPRRPRGRRLARLLGKTVAPRAAVDPRDREILQLPGPPGPVSARLHARLTNGDLAAMRRSLAPEEEAELRAADTRERRQLELSYALAASPSAAAHTGLSALEPPAEVHALVRGRRSLGGAYAYADSMVEALEAAGGNLASARAALDFGCSSGRLVRALGAAHPEIPWHACDPQEGAIAWAARHFPAIAWLASPLEPPLPYADGAFDAVFALSIWSHFGERAGLAWFAEMRRILAPGGHLVLTTHGFATLRSLAEREHWAPEDLERALQAMYRTGFYHHDTFGEGGDWGVPGGEDWGWAFISPEWIQTHLLPDWRVAEFRPGYIDAFQDLLVLQVPLS
jgi:SAM-dependent methyltransferase